MLLPRKPVAVRLQADGLIGISLPFAIKHPRRKRKRTAAFVGKFTVFDLYVFVCIPVGKTNLAVFS